MTSRMGCGYAVCGSTSLYICNYLTDQSNTTNPFVPGWPCSGCPDKCVDGKLCGKYKSTKIKIKY